MITSTAVSAPVGPAALERLVQTFANRPQEWQARVRFNSVERWWERCYRDDSPDLWLIGWPPGESNGFHDHGGSAGAFLVIFGELEEHWVSLIGSESGVLTLHVRESRAFGPRYVHDVRNVSASLAVTLHAYSPPLTEMNHYDLTSSGLVWTSIEREEEWGRTSG